MTELDSWSKDLILAAKGADDPSEAQRARLRTSVLAATATAGIAAGSATAAATGKSAVWLKLLLGLVSLGAVSGVGYAPAGEIRLEQAGAATAPRTVDNDWKFAKAWLHRAIEGPATEAGGGDA